MPATSTIKADAPAIQQYYTTLKEAEGQGALHEGNVRAAFENLLRETAKDQKGWILVNELGERRESNRVEYDGVLRDTNRLPHGWWEAKDTSDDLDAEIRKKRERGYRFDNIIFEDTREAVLYQDGLEVVRRDLHQAEQLADLLTRFYGHEIEPFTKFGEAVAFFQSEIPHIAGGLKDKIEASHRENKNFRTAYDGFMELCRTALNPNLSEAAADEMLIQHMLTERLIRKVFNVEEFTRRNVIAAEIEKVIDSLASQHFNRHEFLGALDRFYTAIEEAADRLATFTEKQDFIKRKYHSPELLNSDIRACQSSVSCASIS
jgi:Type ISP restriction-modification enzyme, coupler domain